MTRPCFALALALVLALSLAAGPGQAADEDAPSRYAAQAPLTLAAGAGLQRVALPLALLQQSRSPSLADVRVFNADGQPVPMAWAGSPPAAPSEPRRVALTRYAWPGSAATPQDLPALKIELRTDGTVLKLQRRGSATAPPEPAPAAWLLDLQPLGDERPRALRLQWPAPADGLVLPVRVMASADAQTWVPVGEATLVQVVDGAGSGAGAGPVLQREVPLAPLGREQRWLRLQAGRALPLDAVEAELAGPAAEPPLAQARFTLQPEGPRSWTLDTGATLPVRRAQVALAQDNAVAPLQWQRRDPADRRADAPWQDLLRHTAWRLQRDGSTAEAPSFALAVAPTRLWRVVLDERVAPLALPPQVTLWWVQPQLLIAARGPAPFTLALGRDAATPSALDRSVLLPGYREGDEFRLPEAVAGEARLQPVADRPWTEVVTHAAPEQRRRWLLWGMLVLAVGSLGALAWRLARDLRKAPDDGPAA